MTPHIGRMVLGCFFLTAVSADASDPAAQLGNFNFSIFEVTAGREITVPAPTDGELLAKGPDLSAVSVYGANDWNSSLDIGEFTARWGSLSRAMAANSGLVRRAEELLGEWRAQDAVKHAAEADSDGLLNEAIRTVFPEPSVYQIGHLQIGGGVVNAIRQRNPFCLLNPLHVFWLSF